MKIQVTFERDDSCGTPWDEEDGHGPVSGWERRDKRPGELILCSDNGCHRFYDFQEAVRIARKDWGCRRQEAPEIARSDYDRLRRWCDDQWEYVVAKVEIVSSCGITLPHVDYLGGIESDCTEGIEQELTGEARAWVCKHWREVVDYLKAQRASNRLAEGLA